MKTIINKQQVMKKAHELYNSATFKRENNPCAIYRWVKALKTAWRILKFKARSVERQVLIKYQKIDGTIRIARATLRNDLIPQFTTTTTHKTKTNKDVQVYYDLSKNGWRSFRLENLIEVI